MKQENRLIEFLYEIFLLIFGALGLGLQLVLHNISWWWIIAPIICVISGGIRVIKLLVKPKNK